jgi:hypothetical protein
MGAADACFFVELRVALSGLGDGPATAGRDGRSHTSARVSPGALEAGESAVERMRPPSSYVNQIVAARI